MEFVPTTIYSCFFLLLIIQDKFIIFLLDYTIYILLLIYIG